MERVGTRYAPIAALAVMLASCAGGVGFQGGIIPEKFKGIKKAEAISPESIQLSWDAYPGASSYKLYSSESNNAIGSPQFTSVVFKPNASTASSTRYSLTAVDPSNGSELGSRASYVGPVSLLPRFNYKATGSLVPVEAAGTNGTRLKATWTGYPNVTYRVYLGERSPDGIVNYNSFVNSTAPVVGVGTTTITGLLPGREYCTVAVANYIDNTNDGPDGTPFTTETTATLIGWSTGASGGFGDSKIASSQLCARTSSSLSVDRVKIYSQKAFLSTRPTFYVFDSDHPVENDATAGFETSIYQVSNTTGLATFVGKATGSGQITSLTDLSPGRYKFYAMVTGKVGVSAGSMAKKEIIVPVGNSNTEPTEANRSWIYLRGMPTLEDATVPTSLGYYPAKQQDGFGSQHLGSSVAMGDFDCDGKYDVAVGVPDATETSSRDGRSAQLGKVVIYYSVDDTVGPHAAPTPRSQVISFDITPYDTNGRDLRLGTSLFVGNFNKDNQRTNQNNPSGEPTFQCHDLVIGSGYGPMFVLYGKRNVSGLDGGLNYSGVTGYAVNPSSSCDTSSNVCSPALYTLDGFDSKVGLAVSSGDFSGGGYEDLVATTLVNGRPGGILAFRGSEYGLIPPSKWIGTRTTAQGCTEDFSPFPFPDGPKKGYPYIPSDVNCFSATPLVNVNGWGSNGFGISTAVFPKSYYDLNTNTTGTRRIRDTLLIGNPSVIAAHSFDGTAIASGRVYVCRPKTMTTAIPGLTFASSVSTYDMVEFFEWICGYDSSIANSMIDAPLDGTDVRTKSTTNGSLGQQFGSAMTSLRNPLLYDVNQLSSNGNAADTTDVGFPGGVAIGANYSSKVFVYYGVNFPEGAIASSSAGSPATRDQLGAARNDHFSKLINGYHAGGVSGNLSVAIDNPCKIVNSGGVLASPQTANTAYYEKCDIQMLSPPQGADWSGFEYGSSLYTLMGSNAAGNPIDKQSVIAAPAPLRAIASSGGVVYDQLGSVQLYYQNVVSASNGYAIRTQPANTSCSFCRFSNGFANAGSSSVDFNGTKYNNVRFGNGGIAAGPTQAGSASSYNSNSDLVIGVPGYVFQNGSTPVVDSGAAQILFSHSGQFRPYQITGASNVNSPWHFIYPSFGQEADVRYQQTISMGDIDQDGLDDIAVRVKLGNENKIRIMKGKASVDGSIGFKSAANEYTTFQVQGDSTGGMRIIPAGKLTPSQFSTYFVTGRGASYLYFGSVGGLVAGQPSAFATGGAPRKLYAPRSGYLGFYNGAFYMGEDTSNSAWDKSLPFAHGDFNGDGYEDFAMGFNNNIKSLVDSVSLTDITDYPGLIEENQGRVMIFYGGKDNGFQVQADVNGGYKLDNSVFVPYSQTNTDARFTAPCDATTGVCTKIQMLFEGPTTAGVNTTNFGRSLTTVPAGYCNGKPVSSLLVETAYSNTTSKVFIYKPACVVGASNYTNLSGLRKDTAVNVTATGVTTFNQVINPANGTEFSPTISTYTFGEAMTSVPKIFGDSATANTDAKDHLAISDSNKKMIFTFPISSNGIDNCPAANCKLHITNDTAQGYKKINYSASNVLSSETLFGASLVPIGDVNGDGYADLGVGLGNVTKPGTPNTSAGRQGGILVLFGSEKSTGGLQSHSSGIVIEPSQNAACYRKPNGAAIDSICSPTLIFAPQPSASRDGAAESIYFSRDSILHFGTTQNEGLGSFLFGVPLRDTKETNAADRILRGGAFYVLP